MDKGISSKVKEMATPILAEIKKAKSILLHCHPSPDPDSVGSALAMKFALEQLDKKATVIKGDSEFPPGFKHFPGADDIVKKNFFEIDLNDFDLFISFDSARIEMVSRRGQVKFPDSLKVIAIDHHQTNSQFGSINLVDPSYPATAQILFDLFKEWDIKITPEIAADLFMGIYGDTCGLKYLNDQPLRVYQIATELISLIPNPSELILKMENSESPDFLSFEAEALRNIEVFTFGEGKKAALSFVPLSIIKEKGISAKNVRTSEISARMMTVSEWDITISAVEIEKDKIKFSFRSKEEKYDVATLSAALGGGGHKAAAGLILSMPFEEARKIVVEKVKEMYNPYHALE